VPNTCGVKAKIVPQSRSDAVALPRRDVHGEREGEDDAAISIEVQLHAETWARLTGNPEDRRKAAQSYIESVGGKFHGFWYAFGAHDGYNLWEAPDNVSMAVA